MMLKPLGRILREPLVQFLIIGLAVFAVYGRADERPLALTETLIEVSPDQVEKLAAQFEAVWRRAPTDIERAGLLEDFVQEEVYYREALALGLDRDDTVIRRRLRQKMEFLSEGAAETLVADEATLRAWFTANREAFASPGRVTFRQAFFGDAAKAEAALAAKLDPEAAGRASLMPAVMTSTDAAAVDGTFGTGFFDRVAALPQGGWQGPVTSAYGAHLVWLLDVEATAYQEFAAVRPLVEQAWRREQTETLRKAHYQALLDRYQVVLPGAAAP